VGDFEESVPWDALAASRLSSSTSPRSSRRCWRPCDPYWRRLTPRPAGLPAVVQGQPFQGVDEADCTVALADLMERAEGAS
jgi:hypothetical protein